MDEPYRMQAEWGSRRDTPAALGGRFRRTIDALGALHPLLETWTWGDGPELDETEGEGGIYPFSDVRSNMAVAVERNVNIGENGEPDPSDGYLMLALTDRPDTESQVHLTISAGAESHGSWLTPFCNHATFKLDAEPDPSLITYALWRSVTLLLAETWEATWATAAPADIRPRWCRGAWMHYVSPRFAPLVTPPASAIVEYRPNGGLFLAATNETFQTANPNHMAVAHEIEAALQPLTLLPYPIEDPFL